MRAADVLAQRLAEAGCRFAFGMPGGEVLTLLDAFERAGIRFVLSMHENSAGFMAEAAWHRTGAPAILLATVGPGVVNAVNVAANAEQDRVPLIVISGCVDPAERLTYNHQVLDHQQVFRPVCKESFLMTAEGAGAMADRAVNLALEARPGPVHIDVPISVAASEAAEPYPFRRAALAPVVPAPGPDWERARSWLAEAERPLVIAGYDAVLQGAGKALQAFCEARQIPFLTTYKAKGVVPEDHPLALGAIALSPVADRIAKPLVQAADLILLAGYDPIEMRVGWRDPWDPAETRVIEIVARPNDHYMHHVGLSFVADVGATLEALGRDQAPREVWSGGEPAVVRAALRGGFGRDDDWGPAAIVDEVRKALPRDALASVDSGAHRIVLSQVYDCYEPDGLLQSMGLCTMGCALPLAAGSKLVDPERPSVAFVGDAGLMMVLGELSTLVDHGLPVIVVVFADRSLSLIELKQRRMQLANAGVDFSGGTDYVKLAEAIGGRGHLVGDRAGLRAAVEAGLAAERFTLIACSLDRKAYDDSI